MDTLEKLFRLASIETSRDYLENSSVWNIAFAKKNNSVCVCVCVCVKFKHVKHCIC